MKSQRRTPWFTILSGKHPGSIAVNIHDLFPTLLDLVAVIPNHPEQMNVNGDAKEGGNQDEGAREDADVVLGEGDEDGEPGEGGDGEADGGGDNVGGEELGLLVGDADGEEGAGGHGRNAKEEL